MDLNAGGIDVEKAIRKLVTNTCSDVQAAYMPEDHRLR